MDKINWNEELFSRVSLGGYLVRSLVPIASGIGI